MVVSLFFVGEAATAGPRWRQEQTARRGVKGIRRDPERNKIDRREILSALWVEDRLTPGSGANGCKTATNRGPAGVGTRDRCVWTLPRVASFGALGERLKSVWKRSRQ